MSAASPVLTGSAIHDQQDVAINQHEPPSSSNRSNHAEESQRAENLLVPESEHPISSEHAGPFTELGPDDVNVNSDQRQEHPEYAAYEPHILYDNSPSVDYPMSPIAARGMYNLRSRGSGRSRGNARPKRLPLTQLQPLHLANQNPNTVPPMILQHGPGWPPHASPTMLKAACSPMSQKSSIVSSPRHEELFDVMSPHSTAGSMSPGYVRGHGLNYGRPPSTSGSKNRGSHLRTPSELQGSHFDMPLPQYSPAQTPIVRNSSFMRLHDGTHTPEPSNAQPTGYSHIASRLAGRLPDERGPPIQPLYRRFQELNHRMLLHLQDEVSQLEERLHRLDNRSTQDRQTYSGHTLPESRRAEESMSGELYRRRTDLLGQIGFKLQAYNNLLGSFQTTQAIPGAKVDDIEDYREFLNAEQPIDELEARFLVQTDDLLCLAPVQKSGIASPSTSGGESMDRKGLEVETRNSSWRTDGVTSTGKDLAAALGAMSVSVLVPLVAFLIVPGFVARLVVSLLIAVGAASTLVSTQKMAVPQVSQAAMLLGFYGAAMAILAGVVA